MDVGGSEDVRTGEFGKMNSLSDSCCETFVTPVRKFCLENCMEIIICY